MRGGEAAGVSVVAGAAGPFVAAAFAAEDFVTGVFVAGAFAAGIFLDASDLLFS